MRPNPHCVFAAGLAAGFFAAALATSYCFFSSAFAGDFFLAAAGGGDFSVQ